MIMETQERTAVAEKIPVEANHNDEVIEGDDSYGSEIREEVQEVQQTEAQQSEELELCSSDENTMKLEAKRKIVMSSLVGLVNQ